ncbi:hypothetical protein BRADI_2g03126v3 [Brachypodium distachyon]|uniref:Uncharacterized protein n=1 Tax=Brachypodium distachyon TaxID=15368 RepID=A0A0Q3ME98_BRADI|nr:hypothetical protein BRADI_2g03126v3 [Brachypodium distachyon]
MRNTKSNHVILQVAADSCPPQSVNFSECPITRQNIFTIAAVETKGKLGLMSGTISIPNCRAVCQNGVLVSESENMFAMSCPAAGPQKLGELK